MQQVNAILTSTPTHIAGTGGFLDPKSITDRFDLREGMRVADFGSGGGYFTIYIAEKVGESGRVYALDILEDKLDSLRAKARANGLENIETIRTNLEIIGSSSLANNSQDLVLLANILFQSNKKDDIFKEASRVLKKDGETVVIDWKKGAGGFGPPDDLRPDEKEVKLIAEKNSLSFLKEISTGQFHFGLIFKK